MKGFLKSLLLKISPTYRKVGKISTQLDKIANYILSTRIEDVKVYINDYNYTSKHRDSLKNSKIGEIIEEWYINNKDEVIDLIQKFCSFRKQYAKIPCNSLLNSVPNWDNGWLPPFDAISIYGFLAIRNPRYYVEVGSGNSTLFAAQAITDNNLRTKIISIDPFPRANIDKLCMEIFRVPFENMDLDFFSTLSYEDVLLIDNSHRSFPNSDVTVFFTEVLPRLPSGLLYALHDIFLPMDYPATWSNTELRWYNEQYLLCAYIIGGASGDKIKCPNSFLCSKSDVFTACNSLWGDRELFEEKGFGGGFFWLEKA